MDISIFYPQRNSRWELLGIFCGEGVEIVRRPTWKKTNESWEDSIIVWERMAQGDTDSQIVEWLGLQGHHRDRKTVGALRLELNELPKELATTLPRIVLDYWKTLSSDPLGSAAEPHSTDAPTDESHNATRWDSHLSRLVDGIKEIRMLVHNPRLEHIPYTGQEEPLWLASHDWCLMPEEWVRLVTPDFSDEALYGNAFPQLKQHLSGSPFLINLDELHKMAFGLEMDIKDRVKELGKRDLQLQKVWHELETKRKWELETSRTPLNSRDWENTKPPYGDGFAAQVCLVLYRGPMPDIYNRLWKLVEKLDQLNKNLDPDIVDKLLIYGACDQCRGIEAYSHS